MDENIWKLSEEKEKSVVAGLLIYMSRANVIKTLRLSGHQFPFVIGSFQRNYLATSKESSQNIS
jgi:hypothetical protein